MRALVLVLCIVGGIGLVQAAVWIPLFRRWRKRSRAFMDDFDAERCATGERIVIPPESAVYRGSKGSNGAFSAVKGNGTIVLTDRRLLFRKLTGGVVEVPLATITGTHESKSFHGSRVGGATHLVVETNAAGEVAFFVTDRTSWVNALAAGRGG